MDSQSAGHLTEESVRLLDAASFMGVPLGRVVEVPLYLALAHNRFRSMPWRMAWRLRESPPGCVAAAIAKGWLRTHERMPVPARRVLFWTFTAARCWDQVLPVAERIRDGAAVVAAGPRRSTPNGVPIVDEAAVAFSPADWYEAVKVCQPQWRSLATDVCRTVSLPSAAASLLRGELLWASAVVMRAHAIMDAARPAVVVVISDHHQMGAALCNVARLTGATSVAMQHGLLNEIELYGNLPLLADRYLAWGPHDAEIFSGSGVPPTAIDIVGCGRLPAPRLLGRTSADLSLRALGIPQDKPIAVLLGTSHEETNAKLVRIFCAAIARVSGWVGVVRNHPGGRRKARVLANGPAVWSVANDVFSMDETAAFASAVVAHDTTAALDFALRGCPIVALDCMGGCMSFLAKLVEIGGAVRATDADSLALALGQCTPDRSISEQRRARVRGALAHFVALTGHESDEVAAAAIMRLAGRPD